MEKLAKQIIAIYSKINASAWPKNWFLQAVSLFLALFLWFFVTGEDKVEINVTIPVEIVNLPSDLIISNQYKKQLDVTVTGPRGLIRGLSKQHISRSIDLSKATPGATVIKNDPDSIPFPRGIRVLRIQPSNVSLLLDQVIKRELLIKPVTIGYPAPGFELGSITMLPPTVLINGPKSLIGNKTFLQTTPLDLSGLKTSTVKQTTLDVDDDISNLLSDILVNAQINIIEKRVRKSYSEVPITPDNLTATSLIISPPTVTIVADLPFQFIGSGAKARNLIKAKVSIDGLTPGSHEIKVAAIAPPEIRIHSISPEMVNVIIGEKQLKRAKPPPHQNP